MAGIRILQLEDDRFDAELITSTLARDGLEFEVVLVDTREDYVAALEDETFDLVLADYSLPAFDGITALGIVRERLPDLPFILVSGTLGEDVAIESLKAGATDYVLKHNLSRLAPSVRRALRETEMFAERLEAEIEVRASEERYRLLFERNVAGVYRTTIDGRVLDCNEAVAKIFGCASPEEVIAGGTLILYNDFSTREAILDELRRKGSITAWEHTMRSRDGREVSVVESASLVEDESGEPTIIEGSLIDVTERRVLEQQLVQAQKLEALGQLAGGIAHDFNNLLMSITGSAELLGFRFSGEETASQELNTIREAVTRGAELTQRLLAIARQQVLEIEVTDLRPMIDQELKILRRVIPENIRIDYNPPTDLPNVMTDHGQLGQVLMNLVVNARDAMPKGGTITIKTKSTHVDDSEAPQRPGVTTGSYVTLSVQDTGVGMDAVTLAHIFEPFFTTKADGEGTGMGLATVYGIVKQHKGFIEIASTPGEGTAFDVFLPVATAPAVTRKSPTVHETTGGDETVLVVEDEAAVRAALVGMLKARGYTVIEAGDGSDALEILERGTVVDLVVSDVVMPKMGGRELLENTRKLAPHLPFLFSSGYTDVTLRDLLATEERTSFISKPFTMAQLSSAMRQALAETGE